MYLLSFFWAVKCEFVYSNNKTTKLKHCMCNKYSLFIELFRIEKGDILPGEGCAYLSKTDGNKTIVLHIGGTR